MAEYVKVEQDGRVAIVTLDHPPVNALSSQLLEELEEEYDRLDRDDEMRAIVLRGEGEKAFVAGADITEFPAMREQIEEAAETGSRARDPEAGRADGRRPHAGDRRDPRLLPRRRPRAGDGVRHPDRGRGRAARPAGDQARPDPGRRRHAAAAAARRPGARAAAQPLAATRSRARRPTTGASSRRRCRATELHGRGARAGADAVGALAVRDGRDQGARRRRRATCRSPRGCAARRRASSAASAARTAPRA